MEKIPALTRYQQALNSYNPDVYPAHKRITAEEWNALLLSGFAQGNRQEAYLDEIINGHLSEVIDTINEVIDAYDDRDLRIAILETHSEESDQRIAAAVARLTTLETDTLQQLYEAIETKTNVQSDWRENSTASDAYIKNKPNPLMTSNFAIDENGVITLTFIKDNGDYERHIYDTNLEKIVANLDFVTVDGITYLRLTREDGSFIDLPLSELADYITTITKTSSEGLVDTYTITLRSGTTFTFDVTNGSNIEDITVNGDVFTFTRTDGVVKTVTVGTDAVLADLLLAEDVPYDNTNSALTATDVQAAIDELDELIDKAVMSTDTITLNGGNA